MTTSGTHFLGGMLFLLAGTLVLANFQPVWWSIASIVIVFAAATVLFGRALIEWRRSRADSESIEGHH